MLRKGQRIKAKLIEAVDKDHWIVSFQGQLVQVRNSANIQFKEGMFLNLQVEKENPILLKVLEPSRNRSSLNVIA